MGAAIVFITKTCQGRSFIFFCFPTDRKLRDRWCTKIKRDHGRDGFFVSKSTQICNVHFNDTDIKRTLNGVWILKQGAEPKDVLSDSWSPKKRRVLHRSTFEGPSTSCGVADEQTTNDDEPMNEDESLSDTMENDVQVNQIKENEQSNDVTELKESVQRLKRMVNSLTEQNERNKFVSSLEGNDSLTKHYTGFPTYSLVLAMLSFLNPGESCENVITHTANRESEPSCSVYQPPSAMDLDHSYSASHKTHNKPGRTLQLSPKEQFILVLCRLRQGFSVKHLAYLFSISESSVSRYFITWINFMYFKLGSLPIWPSKSIISKTMPQTFRDKYPDTRVIVDCSEIFAHIPDSLMLQSMFWSNYKHHITYKGLLGIAPSGAITFISQLYPGSMSDREIVIRSGFLDPKLFQKGDVVMADRGFTIDDLLKPMGVKLNIPAFFKERKQFEEDETIETQQIAAERIHVERAINKVKKFRIFDSAIPLTMHGSINQIWTVCCLLTNSFNPVISMSGNV
ncbi:uncharacterized protein LOC117304428 [Asterias rubens]|uniref:uncharacterized protein LOC117304428 n=1 Tax=Asterias rubens TaxID=7604 RepID=UPI001455BBC7|nr:uncharacterized protein LOC117304428 [Asterias rubens]